MLIKLEMCYSGKKFTSLYNAIDRNNDGGLSLKELNHVLFPKVAQEEEEHERAVKVQSHLDQELNHLEKAMDHQLKRSSDKISSLKSLKSLTLAAQAARTWQQQRGSPKSGNAVAGETWEGKFPLGEGGEGGEKEPSPSAPVSSLRKKMIAQQLLKALHASAAATAADEVVSESVGNPIQDTGGPHASPTLGSPPPLEIPDMIVGPPAHSPVPLLAEDHSSPPLVIPLTRDSLPSVPLAEGEEPRRSPPRPRQQLSFPTPSFPSPSSTLRFPSPQELHPSPADHHLMQRVRRHLLLESNRIEPFDPSTAAPAAVPPSSSAPPLLSVARPASRGGCSEIRRRGVAHSLTSLPTSASAPSSPQFFLPRTPLPAVYQSLGHGESHSPAPHYASHRPPYISSNSLRGGGEDPVEETSDENISPTHLPRRRPQRRRRSNSWDIGGSFDSGDDHRDRERERDEEQPQRRQLQQQRQLSQRQEVIQPQSQQRRYPQPYPTSRSYQI
jgi:hypothetical protein